MHHNGNDDHNVDEYADEDNDDEYADEDNDDEYGDEDDDHNGDEYGDAPHKVLSNLAVRLLFRDLSHFSGFAPSSLQKKLCKYF